MRRFAHCQSDEKTTFADFKTKLWSFEDTEKLCTQTTEDNVMKVKGKTDPTFTKDEERSMADIIWFKCGVKGVRKSNGAVFVKMSHTGMQTADADQNKTT